MRPSALIAGFAAERLEGAPQLTQLDPGMGKRGDLCLGLPFDRDYEERPIQRSARLGHLDGEWSAARDDPQLRERIVGHVASASASCT